MMFMYGDGSTGIVMWVRITTGGLHDGDKLTVFIYGDRLLELYQSCKKMFDGRMWTQDEEMMRKSQERHNEITRAWGRSEEMASVAPQQDTSLKWRESRNF